jgi:hypothetical protein
VGPEEEAGRWVTSMEAARPEGWMTLEEKEEAASGWAAPPEEAAGSRALRLAGVLSNTFRLQILSDICQH